MRDDEATPISADLPYFVTCFTPLEDDTSHWQRYGGGEAAYAIGVRTKNLCGPAYSRVGRVNYDSRVHTAIVNEAALKTVEYYTEGLEFGLANWDDLFREVWDSALTQLTPFVKDPEFAAEKEVRFVHYLQESEIPQLRVLPRKTMISQHLPMRFGASGEKHLFPIARVIVGPCRHRQISRRGASEKPYQET